MPDPNINFASFVLSLAATAAVHFGDRLEPGETEAGPVDLQAAGQMIDILALLEEKTRGNLTRGRAAAPGNDPLRTAAPIRRSARPGKENHHALSPAAARVLVLGTGTSHGVPMIGCDCATCTSTDPRDRRSRASIVIQTASGSSVLVDTTPDLRSQALAHNVRRVDAIVYTHSHADHVMGLDDVRRFNVLQKSAIPCYGDDAHAAGFAPHLLVHLRCGYPAWRGHPTGRPRSGAGRVLRRTRRRSFRFR